jgi:hypothetical protein
MGDGPEDGLLESQSTYHPTAARSLNQGLTQHRTHTKNLLRRFHLLVPEGRAMSELKVSATIFHVPSDCFAHTPMSLPLS